MDELTAKEFAEIHDAMVLSYQKATRAGIRTGSLGFVHGKAMDSLDIKAQRDITTRTFRSFISNKCSRPRRRK